jgi:alkylhydroperoxidase family enzyme
MIGWVSSIAAGCRYCQAHTISTAGSYGAEKKQLDNILKYKTHESFSDGERAALDFALVASIIPKVVDEKIKIELNKYWNDREIIEILGVISLFGYLNRWNVSMATTLENEAVESAKKYLSKK